MGTAEPDHNSRHQRGSHFSRPEVQGRNDPAAPRRAIDNVLSVAVPSAPLFRCSSPECGYARNFFTRIAENPGECALRRRITRPNLGAAVGDVPRCTAARSKSFRRCHDQGTAGQTRDRSSPNRWATTWLDPRLRICRRFARTHSRGSVSIAQCSRMLRRSTRWLRRCLPGTAPRRELPALPDRGASGAWGPSVLTRIPSLGFATEAGTGANAATRVDSGNDTRQALPNDALPAIGGADG